VYQGSDEKGSGKHAGLGDFFVIELFQSDSRAGGSERCTRNQDRPGQDPFGNVHDNKLKVVAAKAALIKAAASFDQELN
jgi:hypothetical protein